MVDITENFVTECLLKVQTLIKSICGIFLDRKWYMDGWIKLHSHKKERENTIYL